MYKAVSGLLNREISTRFFFFFHFKFGVVLVLENMHMIKRGCYFSSHCLENTEDSFLVFVHKEDFLGLKTIIILDEQIPWKGIHSKSCNKDSI